MTHTNKRLWLIKFLLSENERYKDVQIPADSEEQFNLYRSLVNVRMPAPISEEYLQIEDEYLKNLIAENGITEIENLTESEHGIYLWQGDITTLKCDAIVNAANSQMLGCFVPCHACIDNCIHTFSGIRLRMKCAEIMKNQGHEEPTGTEKITPAYNLPCRYVLHTVGPIVNSVLTEENKTLLASCYTECLKKAQENKLDSIAFCCISTGIFGFPQEQAAEIAINTVRRFMSETGSSIKVIFNVFKDKDREIYEQLLG
ncbi:MAG: protein-ADP-ribose hydrolase [Clostridia bacterium]|nr:protein-ADP-ribose hydrolase [Clostridia bacterium]